MNLESWAFGPSDAEVANGRLWKARDRLQGHMVAFPTDQRLLDRLGEIHFRMGDLPQAGRYWWLTERDDEPARQARDAFYERFGTKAPSVLSELPRPARPEFYPPAVKARLEELAEAARDQGMSWTPRDWPPKPGVFTAPQSSPASRVGGWFLAAFIIFLLASVVVGMVTIGAALVDVVF